ncbi:class I SAM-dependent methyltransferase [Candidatus Uhrbacteria bacterium]|nr:class I SAM-dependent methyltransferase [Candidatus Uhrbacteria bacterium]
MSFPMPEPKLNQTPGDKSRYDQRFAGVLGEHYDLRARVMPYHEQFQDTVKDTLADFAKKHPEASILKVLEVGCGTGQTSIRILEADPRIKVVSVDTDEKLMEKAKKVLADMADRIEFIHQDILSVLTAMPDQSMDAMASGLTIHNFTTEYRLEVMKEVARVLKSGGLFVNADKYAFDDPEAHAKSLKEQIDSFEMFDTMHIPGLDIPKLKKGWVEHYQEDEKTKITESEQIKMLEDLGFKDIKVIFRESMEAVITATKK